MVFAYRIQEVIRGADYVDGTLYRIVVVDMKPTFIWLFAIFSVVKKGVR